MCKFTSAIWLPKDNMNNLSHCLEVHTGVVYLILKRGQLLQLLLINWLFLLYVLKSEVNQGETISGILGYTNKMS